MDKKKLMIAGATGVGFIGLIIIRRRAAASAASAAASANNGAADLSSYVSSGLGSVSTGVSTGGSYSLGSGVSSDSSSGTLPDPTAQTNSTVSNFAALLQGILKSGSDFAQQAQTNSAANNAQAVAAVQAAAPVSSAVAAAPAVAAPPAYSGDRSLVNTKNGYLVANPGLYATDSSYRAAWDNVSSANSTRFGGNWNNVGAGADSQMLNVELSDSINPGWRNQQAA